VLAQKKAGAVMITASHNPYRWNGVKFKARYGGSATSDITSRIERHLARVLAEGAEPPPPKRNRIQPFDVITPYLHHLATLADVKRITSSGLRIVADPMYGVAAGCLPRLLASPTPPRAGPAARQAGSDKGRVTCVEIRAHRDPLFPGINPEPIEPHIEALRQKVIAENFDVGFAFDGDGDRIGAVDRTGQFVDSHKIFSILLWHLGGTRKLAGDVAKTFSTTKMVDKIAFRLGRTVFETPVGFKYIADLMRERDILIGGEESGGIGVKMHIPERDATLIALLLAEVMAYHGKTLGQLVEMLSADFGPHFYGRIDLELHPEQKEKAVAFFSDRALHELGGWSVEDREDLDGVKLYLKDAGWVMIRASGTEPILRLYAEAPSSELVARVLAEVERISRNC
jgi:phosphomannomutase